MGFNKDEVEGKWNVGRAINDRDLETEGKMDRVKGNVKEGVGEVRRKTGEAIEEIGEDIKR